MVTGWQKASNGNLRYFDKSTGYMLTGMKQIDGYTYYFAKSNGVLYQKGFGTLSGKKYYFNPNGIIVKERIPMKNICIYIPINWV